MNILVTAGPTREPIDPVRFISNRSSGKMGYAIAAAAFSRGHRVCLVSGPVSLPAPSGVDVVSVESAAQMHAAVVTGLPKCDVLIMSAAVADWRPRTVSNRKLKKHAMDGCLELERTADILQEVRPLKGDRLFVGFAAETHDMIAEAERKLKAKGLDLIIANDVSARDSGFAVDTNRVTLINAQGNIERWPLLSKAEVATRLLECVEQSCQRNRR
jgi:phosphopantothenoylcysteine decarboxylase/phosphopantothenate--cysteine ligase